MTDDWPSARPSLPARVADVQLRGRAGPLRARAYWPAPAPGGSLPLLVLFPLGTGTGAVLDGGADGLGRELSSRARVVVLAVACRPPEPDSLGAALEDATTATHWAADHAAELGADPRRLVVAGEGVGADLAATVARHARVEGWPPILRQVIIRPRLGAATLGAGSLVDLAPATVVADPAGSDDGRRYASLLRRSGVPVHELSAIDDAAALVADLAPTGPGPDQGGTA